MAEDLPNAPDSPVIKWAGAPSDGGGMGGTVDAPRDENYDPSKKPNPYKEVGASGLAQYGGFVREEFLVQLSGDQWLKTAREMYDNDPIIGALVYAVQMIIRGVEWRIEPPEAATVEDIVEERFQERAAAAAERQQGMQMKMMEAQQGMVAGGGPGGGGPTTPGGGPKSPLATSHQKPTPIHQGVGQGQPGQGDGLPGQGGSAQSGTVQKSVSLRDRVRKFFKAVDPTTEPGKVADNGAPPASPGMAGDPEASATVDPQQAMTGQAPPELSPEQRQAEELAVFVETCFHDMGDSWADTLAQIITFIVFGFAFHEIVYKKRNGPNPDAPESGSRFNDGKIGWAKMAGRAQESRHRWEFDDNGTIIGMWQLAPPKFQLRYIPLSKGLLFRTTALKNNPEGRSVIRPAYRSWFFKKRIEEYEAIGVERDLAGLPVAYVPYEWFTGSATAEEKASLAEVKKIVRNLRRNEQEGVVFPQAFDPENGEPIFKLELLASPSRRQFDTDKIIGRKSQEMAMTAMADFLLLGHEGVGSHSLGDVKADLFQLALEAILTSIADVINTCAIPRLLQINGEDPAMCPKIKFGSVKNISLENVAAFITALSGAGADLFPDTNLEDFLRELGGLPPKASSDDL